MIFWYGQDFELRVLMQHEMLHVCIKLGHHRHRCLVFTIWFGWPLHQWEKQTDLRVTNQNCCLLVSWKHKCCLMFTIRFENLTGVPLYTGIARWNVDFFQRDQACFSMCANGAELIIYLFSALKTCCEIVENDQRLKNPILVMEDIICILLTN